MFAEDPISKRQLADRPRDQQDRTEPNVITRQLLWGCDFNFRNKWA